VGGDEWENITRASSDLLSNTSLPDLLATQTGIFEIPDFLPELARLERASHIVSTSEVRIPEDVKEYEVNPTLDLLQLSWRLSHLLSAKTESKKPEPGEEWAMVWKDPKNKSTRVEAASHNDLLVLKIISEDLVAEEVAAAHNMPIGSIDTAFRSAVKKGIVLAPKSLIRRTPESVKHISEIPEPFLSTNTFTLQWHITHACDLKCKHCYDRSDRSPLTLEDGKRVLNDLRNFCKSKHVRGHVCFSGGNPFLHPDFFDLYQSAADFGFGASILGNPVDSNKLKRLIDIQHPGYFQVSLEGLPEHNDNIRGKGFYARVTQFLELLRDLNISSAVMLTLTKDNLNQIIPLADKLRDHADHFTFNRLSAIGSGASLELPDPNEYKQFLEKYVDAAKDNPIMGFKDNLINITLNERNNEPFDGCTGFGCGAAFNFLAVLPDGEVHACRKFPSPLGNVMETKIGAIYNSGAAARYRDGSHACHSCKLKHACGGCLSIAHSHGIDIFAERDPYCFIDKTE
jgi:selenobiotic family peptide radical SAM maturase